jgi:hypothetical protein
MKGSMSPSWTPVHVACFELGAVVFDQAVGFVAWGRRWARGFLDSIRWACLGDGVAGTARLELQAIDRGKARVKNPTLTKTVRMGHPQKGSARKAREGHSRFLCAQADAFVPLTQP